jgi:hypothetical protein
MNKKALVGAVLLMVPLILFGACGGGDNVSQEEYDVVVAERDALQAQVDELQSKCPPGNFSSLTDLESWLRSNSVSEESPITYADAWYRKALRLQQDALQDGYLIFVDYDYDIDSDLYSVWCTTIIHGRIFYWDPESDEVFEEFGLGTVE